MAISEVIVHFVADLLHFVAFCGKVWQIFGMSHIIHTYGKHFKDNLAVFLPGIGIFFFLFNSSTNFGQFL